MESRVPAQMIKNGPYAARHVTHTITGLTTVRPDWVGDGDLSRSASVTSACPVLGSFEEQHNSSCRSSRSSMAGSSPRVTLSLT